jgi:periplasmic protein CpxP/Spy
MKTFHRITSITLAGLALAAAGAAFAHPGMGDGAAPGPMGQRHGAMQGGRHGPANAEAMGARLATLKAELGITPAQEAAWQAYAGVVQQHAQAREAMRTQMQSAMQAHTPGSAPTAEMAAHRDSMQQQRAQFQAEREAARNALLAVLSPEQQAKGATLLQAGGGQRMAQHRSQMGGHKGDHTGGGQGEHGQRSTHAQRGGC